MELETLGNPGVASRASTLARMDASELVTRYMDLTSRLDIVRASISNLTSESQLLAQQVSEVSFVLSFHRTFDIRRIAPGPAQTPGAGIAYPPSGTGSEVHHTGQDDTKRVSDT